MSCRRRYGAPAAPSSARGPNPPPPAGGAAAPPARRCRARARAAYRCREHECAPADPLDPAVLRRRAGRSSSRRPRCTTEPAPVAARPRPAVLVALVGYVALLALRDRLAHARTSTRAELAAAGAASAPARSCSRSSSPTAPASSRSTSRSASPACGWSRAARSSASPSGIVADQRAARSWSARDGTVAERRRRRQRGPLLLHGLHRRASSASARRAPSSCVAELEATPRGAGAGRSRCSERARLAREMHDVLAHSLSALAVQLEGARLLARSRGADPSVVEAVERSHHLARGGLDEARRAIEALRGGDMPGPDRLRRARRRRSASRPASTAALELDGEPRELPLRGAPRGLPHRAGGAHERAPPRRPPSEVELRLRYERRRHAAGGRGPRRGRARLAPSRAWATA